MESAEESTQSIMLTDLCSDRKGITPCVTGLDLHLTRDLEQQGAMIGVTYHEKVMEGDKTWNSILSYSV